MLLFFFISVGSPCTEPTDPTMPQMMNSMQSFAMDADTYEAQQEFAFGFVEGKGAEVKAAA